MMFTLILNNFEEVLSKLYLLGGLSLLFLKTVVEGEMEESLYIW